MKMSKVVVDISDIDKVVNALEILYQDLQKMQKEIPKEIAEEGLKYLNKQYSNLYDDPNIGNISTKITETSKGYNLSAYGEDVIYAEFGTGDRGQEDSHPDKSKYSLNDYNSGPFILDIVDVKNKAMIDVLAQNGITSGKFWSYRKFGETHLTQGIPAGKQMFNTFNYLKDKEVPKTVKKRGEEINDKFIKSIKG